MTKLDVEEEEEELEAVSPIHVRCHCKSSVPDAILDLVFLDSIGVIHVVCSDCHNVMTVTLEELDEFVDSIEFSVAEWEKQLKPRSAVAKGWVAENWGEPSSTPLLSVSYVIEYPWGNNAD